MGLITDIFDRGFDVYKFLTLKSKSNIVYKRMILREIRDNIKRLELRNRKGVSLNVLISKLQNENIVNAMEDNFNFNRLAGEAKLEITDQLPDRMNKYLDWDCKRLVYSIDEKITSLKDIPDMFPGEEGKGINVMARLNNLYIQCILVVFLIRKAEKG